MRVMTFNIQSGRNLEGDLNIAHSERVIRAMNPDICALNEVRMGTRDVFGMEQARELGARLSMRWAFARAIDINGGRYGVALLSRFPIAAFDVFPVPEPPASERDATYEPRVLLRARLETDAGDVAVYVSHYGLSDVERRLACETTLAHLQTETLPAIFMGDLNMDPDDPLIARLSEAISDVTADVGLLSHPSDAPARKIDYIFASPRFRRAIAFACLSRASDHLPLVADLTYE